VGAKMGVVMLTLQVRHTSRAVLSMAQKGQRQGQGGGRRTKDEGHRPATCWLKLLKQKRKDSENVGRH